MNQAENKLMNETQTTAGKILDFLIGLLGSLIVGNLGLLLLAQFDPQLLWISYFKWFWLVALAGLAVFLFTKKFLASGLYCPQAKSHPTHRSADRWAINDTGFLDTD